MLAEQKKGAATWLKGVWSPLYGTEQIALFEQYHYETLSIDTNVDNTCFKSKTWINAIKSLVHRSHFSSLKKTNVHVYVKYMQINI